MYFERINKNIKDKLFKQPWSSIKISPQRFEFSHAKSKKKPEFELKMQKHNNE